MTIHINYDEGQVRWYLPDDDPQKLFESRIPFIAEANIKKLSPKSVYLWAHRGEMSFEMYRDLGQLLHSYGVEYVFYEKRGELIKQNVLTLAKERID